MSGAASATGSPPVAPVAGYQNSVGSVRVEAPPNEPLGDVVRDESTNVTVVVPTAYRRLVSIADSVAVVGTLVEGSTTGALVGVVVDVGAAVVLVDVSLDLPAATWSSPPPPPPKSAMPPATSATTSTTTTAPMASAVRRRRRITSRRSARGIDMCEQASGAGRATPRGFGG